jgi:hypothetical protein
MRSSENDIEVVGLRRGWEAVGNSFYDRVEAGNVAATSENANAPFRHDCPQINLVRRRAGYLLRLRRVSQLRLIP